ncbi:putative Fe-S cluster-containing protein [Methanomicrobium sp. W14]|uniref:(Fe-S)-binding protein n=1 Tax=Methanomicrobium sp. W14 TaxID=2817839 RepID=UPI001AE3A7A8|nr:(Fe-S)-binding protein [Methanomicrobium sp. W14]MBP2133543.1 putative Fe-S cluster-containing protein [Methanomicrobium sp. W14]
MQKTRSWKNTGRDCGACGIPTCAGFEEKVLSGEKNYSDCPFFEVSAGEKDGCEQSGVFPSGADYTGYDILKKPYDFVIHPFPGEPSARKIILPFRPGITEKMKIEKGDIVLGRPQGAGCPVQHVLRVIDADILTGLISSHVISPLEARKNPDAVKEIRAYHIIGFEGLAQTVMAEPVFGRRQRFLPGFCMMNLGHTGVVNFVAEDKSGVHVRVEDIRII